MLDYFKIPLIILFSLTILVSCKTVNVRIASLEPEIKISITGHGDGLIAELYNDTIMLRSDDANGILESNLISLFRHKFVYEGSKGDLVGYIKFLPDKKINIQLMYKNSPPHGWNQYDKNGIFSYIK